MWEVVYGPPGTGKTTHLLARMGSLSCAPERVGFLAFTKAAANEALKRLGLRRSKTIRTLHSLAYEMTKVNRAQVVDHWKLQDFSQVVGFRVTGQSILEVGELLPGDELLAEHSYHVATCGNILNGTDPDLASWFSQSYMKWKKAYGYVDFNDMLGNVLDSRCDADLGLEWLFVDEAQDLSPLQWRVIEKLAGKIPNIVIAGDDDQAIYTWAGADPHGMKAHGSGIVLNKSWRVPRLIHSVAESVAAHMEDRVAKSYIPKDEEGDVDFLPAFDYLSLDGPEETLMLYRNHSSRREAEGFCLKNALPYKVEGLPGAFDDRYASAVRAYLTIQGGNEEIGKAQWNALVRCARPGWKDDLAIADFGCVRRYSWEDVLDIPHEHAEYLRRVDLHAKPAITLSTIHASKGREADHVVLFNQLGAKTYDEIDSNEYRCWYVGVTRAKKKLTIVEGENPIMF